MIKYKSTRGNKKIYPFSEILLKGTADDGGLFVPTSLPTLMLSELEQLQHTTYAEKARFIFELFRTDFTDESIERITNTAYNTSSETTTIAPLVKLQSNQYLLELWHGPTSAFKDMALQLMPLLFSEAITMQQKNLTKKRKKRYLILVGTSGDTGAAALSGYKNLKDISIVTLYPHKKVSHIQELQMTTQEGENVFVAGITGNFDDVQQLVKTIFADTNFCNEIDKTYHTLLSSANSINWGRLLPQLVYYIEAYLALVDSNDIQLGDFIDIAVPTGNFGNILAAFLVKKMGLPIRKLLCASNENNVLSGFIQTGVFDLVNRKVVQTSSPAIDILVASNIERLLYVLTEDTQKVSAWMKDLQEQHKFSVDAKTKKAMQEIFRADWVSNTDCLENIQQVFDTTGYLMDPHTSVAQKVATKLTSDATTPVVICSTAHVAKFAKDVASALGLEKNIDEFVLLEKIASLAPKFSIPKTIAGLKQKAIRHKKVLPVNIVAIKKEIRLFLQKQHTFHE